MRAYRLAGVGGVAGINISAFVERRPSGARSRASGGVSPGLTSRPSLSAAQARHAARRRGGVAGINISAFVERASCGRNSMRAILVSPGLTSRPSLSGAFQVQHRAIRPCVAGINISAFVERCAQSASPPRSRGVAGINISAFVERQAGRDASEVTDVCRRD